MLSTLQTVLSTPLLLQKCSKIESASFETDITPTEGAAAMVGTALEQETTFHISLILEAGLLEDYDPISTSLSKEPRRCPHPSKERSYTRWLVTFGVGGELSLSRTPSAM